MGSDASIRLGISLDTSALSQAKAAAQETADVLSDAFSAAGSSALKLAENFTDMGGTAAEAFAQLEAQGLQVVQSMEAIGAAQQQAAAQAQKAAADETEANTQRLESINIVKAAYRQLAEAQAAANIANAQRGDSYKQLGQLSLGGDPQIIAILAEYEERAAEAAEELALAKRNLAEAQAFEAETAQRASVAEGENAAAMQTELASIAEDTTAQEANTVAIEGGISARQSATASIGILEGRTMAGTRAAGAFLSTTLGLGSALKIAFPVIGAVALLEVLGQVVAKMEDVYDETFTMKQAMIDNFEGMQKEAEMAAQAWSRTEEIQHEIGMRENPMGTMATDVIQAQQAVSGLAAKYDQAKARLAELEDEQKRLGNFHIKALDLDVSGYQSRVDLLHDQLTQQQAMLADAQSKMSSSQFQADEQAFSELQMSHELSKAEEVRFWQERLATAEQGSQRYREIERRLGSVMQQQYRGGSRSAHRDQSQELEADRSSEDLIDQNAKGEESSLEKVSGFGSSPLQQSIEHAIPLANNAEARQQLVEMAEAANKSTQAIRSLKTETSEDEGAIDSYVENYEKLGAAQVKASDIQDQNTAKINEASIRAMEATGALTPLAAAYAMQAEHARQYRVELEKLNAQLELQEKLGKDAEAADTKNKISELQGSHQAQATGDQANVVNQMSQPYIQAATQVEDAWTQAFDKILRGGRGSWYAIQEAEGQMAMNAIHSAEKVAESYLQSLIKQVVAHAAAKGQQTGIDAAASAQSTAISARTSIQEVAHNAAVAASATWKAVAAIPIVGPALAPPAAAAAYAGVIALAAFETGTDYVPKTGVALIHEGERIIPADQNKAITSALTTGAAGTPSIGSINFSPTFNSGGTMRDARHSVGELHKMLRKAGYTT